MTVRPFVFWIHKWLSLAAALPLLLLGLTGAALVFESELDRVLHPALTTVKPQGRTIPWQALLDGVNKARGDGPVSWFRLPQAANQAVEMTVRGGLLVYADPYTGNVLGSRRRDENVMVKVHQFHTSYLLGKTGQWITGISSIVLIVLGITGVWLWLKVRIVKVKFGVPWKRLNFDAHSAIGLYCSLFWLVLGFTGVTIDFDEATRSVVRRVTGSGIVPQPAGLKSTRPQGGGPSITADDAVAAAARELPGAAVTMITLPAGPAGTYGIALKFPEDRTPAGRSRMVVDRYSGKTLWAFNTRTAAAGTKFLNVQRSLHTGDVYGWPTRILACITSALLALQVITGLWIWWPVRRKRSPLRQQPAEADQLAAQAA